MPVSSPLPELHLSLRPASGDEAYQIGTDLHRPRQVTTVGRPSVLSWGLVWSSKGKMEASESQASQDREIRSLTGCSWDEGLVDMCVGEKRTLTIGPSYGYGQRNVGPIPAGSTLGMSSLSASLDVPESDDFFLA